MSNLIRRSFDAQWKTKILAEDVDRCAKADIYPTLKEVLRPGVCILESGCGSGKWVIFLRRQGYRVIGLDWSLDPLNRARQLDPTAEWVSGDAVRAPFQDCSFDVVLSLGTLEHDRLGPEAGLRDVWRILKPGGVLVATVPLLTPFRRWTYPIRDFMRDVGGFWRLFPRLSSKSNNIPLWKARGGLRQDLYALCVKGPNGFAFFEYRFRLKDFTRRVEAAGFSVEKAFPCYGRDAVFHDLSPFGGRWDFTRGEPVFSVLGRIAWRLFPKMFWHMGAVVARKS